MKLRLNPKSRFGYQSVYPYRDTDRYYAQAKFNQRSVGLGIHDTVVEAALAVSRYLDKKDAQRETWRMGAQRRKCERRLEIAKPLQAD